LQIFAQPFINNDIIKIKIKITDDRAQKTTFDVSPSIGRIDLKLFHNIDLTNTPDQVSENILFIYKYHFLYYNAHLFISC